jgi:hypothetical protein
MTTPSQETGEIQVALSVAERSALVELLEQTLRETRVEVHRTHTPDYRALVLSHENLIRGLIDKLHSATA